MILVLFPELLSIYHSIWVRKSGSNQRKERRWITSNNQPYGLMRKCSVSGTLALMCAWRWVITDTRIWYWRWDHLTHRAQQDGSRPPNELAMPTPPHSPVIVLPLSLPWMRSVYLRLQENERHACWLILGMSLWFAIKIVVTNLFSRSKSR